MTLGIFHSFACHLRHSTPARNRYVTKDSWRGPRRSSEMTKRKGQGHLLLSLPFPRAGSSKAGGLRGLPAATVCGARRGEGMHTLPSAGTVGNCEVARAGRVCYIVRRHEPAPNSKTGPSQRTVSPQPHAPPTAFVDHLRRGISTRALRLAC